jgi:hypothetical protein
LVLFDNTIQKQEHCLRDFFVLILVGQVPGNSYGC